MAKRKKVEPEWAKEHLYSVFIENVKEYAIFVLDTKGVILSWNPGILRLKSYSAAEIIGKHFSIFYLPTEVAVGKPATELTVAAAQGKFEEEGWRVRKDGSKFWASVVITAIRAEDGKLLGFGKIVRDLTDRMRAQENLRISEERFRLIFSKASDAILVVDGPIGSSGVFVEANERALQMLGYSSEELRQLHPLDIGFGEGVSDWALSRKRRSEPQTATFRWQFRTRLGQVVPVEVNAKRFELSGRQLYLAICRDISERLHIEEQMTRAKNTAESATRAKSDFLANMSHEIRTPLNAIIGMNYLLGKTALSLKQRDYVKKVSVSSQNLLGIINSVLDMSKIEAGKLTVESVNFDLDTVMKSLIDIVVPKTHDKEVELIVDIKADVPVLLVGDSLRLGQVLVNLVGNAFKFTDAGEIQIVVELRSLETGLALIAFSVQDTGIGMSDEQMARLFQPFSQVDTQGGRKYGGTGLGLAICRRLVELMGGEIQAESAPGKGSRFFFKLPFSVQTETVKTERWKGDLSKLRALVVDDNESTRMVFASYFRELKVFAATCGSGQEAIHELRRAAAARQDYDLVLMDWKMPGIDGLEAARLVLLDDHLEVKPRIILATSYFGTDDLAGRAADMGLAGVLVKPVTPSNFYDVIVSILETGIRTRVLNAGTASHINLDVIRGARILVAEDNPINQDLARDLLEGEGFVVTMVSNGREAIAELTGSFPRVPDLVFMDLQMPELNGYEAVREIRKDARFRDVPIIAMTADALSDVTGRVAAVGMNGYIPKPVDPQLVFETLTKWIRPRAVARSIHREAALLRLGGSEEKYVRLITKFMNNYASAIDEIRLAFDSSDIEIAARLIHDLKGLAGSVGAEELAAAVIELEATVEHADTLGLPGQITKAQTALDNAIKGIRDILSERPPEVVPAAPPPAQTAILTTLEHLKHSMEEDDARSHDLLAGLKEWFRLSAHLEQYLQLEDSLSRYDFARGLAVLRDLINLVISER